MCSVNFMERRGGGDSSVFPRRRSSPLPLPLMDGDGNFSDNSCEEREEEIRRPVIIAKDPPSDDQTLSDPNLDEKSVPRSPSPRNSDFADRNISLSSPSDVDATDVDEREMLGEKSSVGGVESSARCDEVKREKFDGRDDVFVRECPSRSSTSVAGSDKDLGGVKDPPLPPLLQVAAAAVDHPPAVPQPPPPTTTGLPSKSPAGKKDFIADEQNFVQKLESFVASMDRRTKLGHARAATISSSSSLEKGTPHHETYRTSSSSKPLNGVSKHDGGSSSSKYRFYENCSRNYIDGGFDQPLDLSVSTKDKPNGMTSIDGYDESPLLSIPSRPLDVNSVSGVTAGSSSLLASLEKKFGEHSQILDRIGTLPRACHFGGSLALSRGAGFYAPKVSDVSDQVPGCWKNFSFTSASSISSGGLHFGDSRQRSKGIRDSAGKTSFHSMRETTTTGVGGSNNAKHGPPSNRDVVDAMDTTNAFQKRQKTTTTTSLRCSCDMEFDRLFLLTVHLQETGHKPSVVRPDSHLSLDNNTKLVRGQDVWLHNGSEQTRQILRCMECHRSFRSLPELTVHMIQTEHYMNLIQPELTPRRVSTEQGSSSGSESSPDPFACRFCSKIFEDADALGLHIVASGHYRRDVGKQKLQPKIESTSSSSPPPSSGDQPQIISSRYSHQNEMKPTPNAAAAAAAGGGGGGGGGVDYVEMLRAEKAAEGARNEDEEDSPRSESCVEMKKQRKEITMDYRDSSPLFGNNIVTENESNDDVPTMTKLPRLDCVIDHVAQTTNPRHSPSSGSSESTLPPSVGGGVGGGGGGGGGLFYRPPSSRSLQGPTEMPEIPKLEPVDESSTTSPPMELAGGGESSIFSRAEPPPRSVAIVPGKESALTAMQSFINRSFGHSPKESSFRSTQHAQDFGRQQHVTQKSSPWQPASNFLTKLTWPDHSPPSRSSRKRHHNDNDAGGCHRDSGGLLSTENNAEPLSFRDRGGGEMRGKCDARQQSQSYGDSLFNADVLWKSRISDHQTREDRKSRHRESSPCFFPGQQQQQQSPFAGGGGGGHHHHQHHQSMVKHQMTSPVVPLTASSPLNEMNSASRKWERLYEKEEKGRGSDRTNEGMSTLDSLQELVYSKSFKTLEKFMHPGPTTTIAYGLGGGGCGGGADKTGGHQSTHSLVISTKNSTKKTIPETLILVNPIVTVMPTSSGGGSSLSITLPQSYSSPDSEGPSKDNGPRGAHQSSGSPPSMDATDSDGEQFGEFKCLTCKRNFASKGSYRYHRSRYHAYSDMEKSKMKDQMVTNLYSSSSSSHLCSEQTNKFSKYYQLASELSSKSN